MRLTIYYHVIPKKILLSSMMTTLIICLGLLPEISKAGPLNAIQNSTIYNFKLTKATLNNASCSPSCAIDSILKPGAVQNYVLRSSTSNILFYYDVMQGTSRVGQIALKASPLAVELTNGLGATVVQGVTASEVKYIPPKPIWTSQFTDPKNWQINNLKLNKSLPTWGLTNLKMITTLDSPKKTYYLRANYPKGSANSGSSPPLPLGGAQFYANVIKSQTPITFSFWVRFPTQFPFKNTSGTGTLGKLPGLYSGKGNTGDTTPTGYDGWTTRFMWCSYAQETKRKVIAGGEIVQFTYGSDKGLYGSDKGKFIGCGNWYFSPDNKWHNIQQTIHLNDLGKANGRIDVCYDGKLVYSVQNITFRLTSSLAIDGFLFQTFFGGTGKEYATPVTTYADFADFALYNYPTTGPKGLCVTNP